MSDQPKPTTDKRKSCDCDDPSVPTGEWTVESVSDMAFPSPNSNYGPWKRIADAHNAALAAALAAATKPFVDALEEALSDIETSNDPLSTCSKIRTELAKVAK